MVDTKIRLYVKSVKTVTGTVEVEQELFGGMVLEHPDRVRVEGRKSNGTFRLRQFALHKEPKYEFVLPEDQQKTVETIKDISQKYSLEVEMVDVARKNFLRRIMTEKQEKIKVFPTLIADSGLRIEGNMTCKEVESFMSGIASEKRKKYF